MTTKESSWVKKTLPLWIGQFISLFGSGIVQFSIVWYLAESTGSKIVLASATLMALIPGILIATLVGHFVDKYNRKTTMIISDIISASMMLVLIVLLYYDLASIPIVLLLMFTRSIANQFQSSALFASIPQIVPENSLEKVAGMQHTMDGILSMVSIPIAAVLLSIWSIHSILSIDIFTAILGVSLLLIVEIPKNGLPYKTHTENNYKKFTDGFKLLFSYKYIFYKSLISASINLFLTPAVTFLPLLVKNNFQQGPETLALLQISSGIGIVSGGLLMSSWGGFKKRTITLLLGLGLLGFSLLSAGIVSNMGCSYLLLIPMFLGSLSLSISNSSSGAITQSKVRDEHMGKVSGASGSISLLMVPVGLLIATPVTELIGIPGWLVFAGITSLIIVFVSSLSPEFLNYSYRGEK